MKKTIARILALVMVAAMLLSALPAVFADEINKGTLPPGAAQSVTMKAGDIFLYSFTPAQSGDYMLGSSNSVIQPSISAVSQNGSWGEDGWAYTMYPLEGGVTYTVEVHYWDPSNTYPDGCTADVKIVKCDPLKSISLNKTTATGRVGETVDLIATTDPVYINQEALKWSVDNVSVASVINDGPSDCSLRLENPGTVTVTATLGGCSASCVITVESDSHIPGGAEVWPVQTPSQTLTLAPGQTQFYTFSPAETGKYVIYHSTSVFRVSIEGPGSPHQPPFQIATPSGTMNGSFAELIAGETYTILVSLHEFEPQSFTDTVHLEKAQPLQSIRVQNVDDANATAYTGYVGGMMRLYITTEPAYHAAGTVSWSSSDPTVASVSEYGDIELRSPGTATITVSVDGKTDHCTVTVKEAPVLEPDKSTSLTFIGSTGAVAHFTPAESGRYKFTITGEGGTCYIEETEYGTYFEGTGTMGGDLEGGKTYKVQLGVGPGMHTVKVVKVGDDETVENGGSGAGDGTEPSEPVEPSEPADPTEPSQPDAPTEPSKDMEVTLDLNTIRDILENSGADGSVKISLNTAATSVKLPPEAVQLLIEEGSNLELDFAGGTVTLDSKVLAAVMREDAQAVSIALRHGQMSQLNDSQQDALALYKVEVLLQAQILADGEEVHDFQGGQAVVQVNCPTEAGSEYVIYYVDEEGTLQTMETQQGDGWLRFTTGHFSFYAVVKTAAPAAQTPQPAGWILPVILVAVAVCAAAAVVLLVSKKQKNK